MTQPRFQGLAGGARAAAETPNLKDKDYKGPKDEEMEEDAEAEDDASAEGEDAMDPDDKAGSKPKSQDNAEATAAPGSATASHSQRIADVFASEHFKGREQAAGHLLAETDMSAEAINKTLATLPANATGDTTGEQMLEQAREGGQPDLGDDPSDDQAASGGNPLLAIVENLRKA